MDRAARNGDDPVVSSTAERAEPIKVLLVEDNPADVVLVRKAFQQSAPGADLHVVVDGREAMAFLRGDQPYTGRPRPHLVLLDLNLPRMNGHEVLQHVRQDERLRTLPIVVLTSSEDERDIENSYRLGANCYLTKAPTLAEFMESMRGLSEFWFGTATLPAP